MVSKSEFIRRFSKIKEILQNQNQQNLMEILFGFSKNKADLKVRIYTLKILSHSIIMPKFRLLL